jgi:hypothetical protein
MAAVEVQKWKRGTPKNAYSAWFSAGFYLLPVTLFILLAPANPERGSA